MRTHKESILVTRIQRQSPDALARQTMLARVDTNPSGARIVRSVDAASYFAILICIADKNLVSVPGVHQHAGEISEGKVSAAPCPLLAAIMRHVKSLLGSYVH